MMSDALDCFAAEGRVLVRRRDCARHVVTWCRDEIDLPAAADEFSEVAAVAVDAGRTRCGRVLVHAQQTPGPNGLWPNPLRWAGSRQNGSQAGCLAAAATRPLQHQSTYQQDAADGGNTCQAEPSERQRSATRVAGGLEGTRPALRAMGALDGTRKRDGGKDERGGRDRGKNQNLLHEPLPPQVWRHQYHIVPESTANQSWLRITASDPPEGLNSLPPEEPDY